MQAPENAIAPSEDYFSIFDLPRFLNIDTAALEKQFYALSRRLHPDLFATKPAAEQEWATERSSLLNDAYRTLKEPIARTRYLLKLEGASLEEDSERNVAEARASGKPREQKVPPDLLAEVFELNMQLEELKMGGENSDDADLKEQLRASAALFQSQLAACDSELSGHWAHWDAAQTAHDAAGKDSAKQAMVDLLHRRNYIRNLVRDVQEAVGE